MLVYQRVNLYQPGYFFIAPSELPLPPAAPHVASLPSVSVCPPRRVHGLPRPQKIFLWTFEVAREIYGL